MFCLCQLTGITYRGEYIGIIILSSSGRHVPASGGAPPSVACAQRSAGAGLLCCLSCSAPSDNASLFLRSLSSGMYVVFSYFLRSANQSYDLSDTASQSYDLSDILVHAFTPPVQHSVNSCRQSCIGSGYMSGKFRKFLIFLLMYQGSLMRPDICVISDILDVTGRASHVGGTLHFRVTALCGPRLCPMSLCCAR